jgi:3-hydroxyisobutyrate dehydrogenase-like beta-hydroxyacid dehydrogenase
MEIGVAGLGRMGAAIAARLIEVGHKLTVWNRSPEKAKPLQAAGAALARSPRELAEKVEAVITILTDAAAIEAVYEGPSGLLAGNVSGKLFIEMSTVRPQTAIDLAARVRARAPASWNARSAARSGRRARASSSASWVPRRTMPRAPNRSSSSSAAGSSMSDRSATEP